MPEVAYKTQINRQECDRLGAGIRDLSELEREKNRVALRDGKRNGVCPNSTAGCPVLVLAHRAEQDTGKCTMRHVCPFVVEEKQRA